MSAKKKIEEGKTQRGLGGIQRSPEEEVELRESIIEICREEGLTNEETKLVQIIVAIAKGDYAKKGKHSSGTPEMDGLKEKKYDSLIVGGG